MKSGTTFSIASVLLLLVAGCAEPGPADEPSPSPEYRPTATIADIMLAIIDPSADEIWSSVATRVTIDTVEEEFPETEEEWEAVRSSAIRVLEASNMLLIPGRQVGGSRAVSVGGSGAVREDVNIVLTPAEIQELIDEDKGKWDELAVRLHDMAVVTLAAIDARDTEALLFSGEGLYTACEGCHLNYWYPNDEVARQIFEADERLRLEQSDEDPQ